MEELRDKLTKKAIEYFTGIDELDGKSPSPMLIDFVIEKYSQHRNFPKSFNEKKKIEDMEEHLSTMALAVVDLYLKIGAEGQTSHSENNVSRSYENAYLSSSIFNDILPFVKIINSR